jgi:hypothetical protein
VLEFLRLAMDADHASGSQLKSAELLGKAAGLFTDKLQVETNQASSDDIASELMERLQQIANADDDTLTEQQDDMITETKH